MRMDIVMHTCRGPKQLAGWIGVVGLTCLASLAGCGGTPSEPGQGFIELYLDNRSFEAMRVVYSVTPGVDEFDDFRTDEDGNPLFLQGQDVRDFFAGPNQDQRLRLPVPPVLTILAVQFYDSSEFENTFESSPLRQSNLVRLTDSVEFSDGDVIVIRGEVDLTANILVQ